MTSVLCYCSHSCNLPVGLPLPTTIRRRYRHRPRHRPRHRRASSRPSRAKFCKRLAAKSRRASAFALRAHIAAASHARITIDSYRSRLDHAVAVSRSVEYRSATPFVSESPLFSSHSSRCQSKGACKYACYRIFCSPARPNTKRTHGSVVFSSACYQHPRDMATDPARISLFTQRVRTLLARGTAGGLSLNSARS